jgi:hypothetical protein
MAEGLEFGAQLAEIIDFPVVKNRDGAGFVPNRLAAAWKIDDAEPAHSHGGARRDEQTLVIRPAMHERGQHAAHGGFTRRGRLNSDGAANSAHAVAFRLCSYYK